MVSASVDEAELGTGREHGLGGERFPVEPDYLDHRRPLGNFKRLNRRQGRGDEIDRAAGPDRRPQADRQRQVEQAAFGD